MRKQHSSSGVRAVAIAALVAVAALSVAGCGEKTETKPAGNPPAKGTK